MFIIRGYPRCGTNMLATALGSHSKIKNYGELFHMGHHGYQLKRLGAVGWIKSQQMGLHDGFLVHGVVPGDKRLREVYEELWSGIKAFQPPMVILERENILARYASQQLAEKTRIWRRDHDGPAPTMTVELDPNAATTSYLQLKQNFAAAAQEFPWAYRVSYEQLVRRWDRHLRNIQAMLGLAIEDCKPTTKKQDSRPIQEIVSNYDEFKAALVDKPAWQELFTIAEAGKGLEAI